MDDKTAYILVWGATIADKTPLFPTAGDLEKDSSIAQGPPAGPFRQHILSELNEGISVYAAKAVLSEEWETHNHAPENAGLYEPIQLENASLVVMLLPGPRALAVNTWELVLALESSAAGEPSQHFDKLIILLPATVYHYITEVFHAGIADPKNFHMNERTGRPEPSLGVANSFAARWLCIAVCQRYLGADAMVSFRNMSIVYYDDKMSWEIGDLECKVTTGKILTLVKKHLS